MDGRAPEAPRQRRALGVGQSEAADDGALGAQHRGPVVQLRGGWRLRAEVRVMLLLGGARGYGHLRLHLVSQPGAPCPQRVAVVHLREQRHLVAPERYQHLDSACGVRVQFLAPPLVGLQQFLVCAQVLLHCLKLGPDGVLAALDHGVHHASEGVGVVAEQGVELLGHGLDEVHLCRHVQGRLRGLQQLRVGGARLADGGARHLLDPQVVRKLLEVEHAPQNDVDDGGLVHLGGWVHALLVGDGAWGDLLAEEQLSKHYDAVMEVRPVPERLEGGGRAVVPRGQRQAGALHHAAPREGPQLGLQHGATCRRPRRSRRAPELRLQLRVPGVACLSVERDDAAEQPHHRPDRRDDPLGAPHHHGLEVLPEVSSVICVCLASGHSHRSRFCPVV
mmetsp:Transcript_81541/g.227984  ORF Transcript_81541/g.227984 Transcript_81541/m.227984 type:complete len:391 (+) Transcript_81541:1533-2705(+)